MGFLKNLKEGLFKSSSNISEGVSNIFLKSKPNEKILEEIEDFMIQCDFGIDVASKFKLILANKKFSEEELKKENFYNIFSEEVTKILQPLEKNIVNTERTLRQLLYVALMVLEKQPPLESYLNYLRIIIKKLLLVLQIRLELLQ